MDNIKISIENGDISDVLKKEILGTFLRRIENLTKGSYSAHVVINPNLSGRKVELLNGNAKRYIIDNDNLVDDETRIRLATLKTNQNDLSILYIFEKLFKPAFKPMSKMYDSTYSYLPTYLIEEIKFISLFINAQKGDETKIYNTFCISGDLGNGKTHLVFKIAEETNSTLWKLSYDDIDAENTGVIAQKTDSFFKKVKSGDFVLIENADSFLCGRDINRFVKNSLIAVLNKRKDFYVFIETTDPSLFENDIKKDIFRYIYIKPLTEEERKKYLILFLNQNGIAVKEQDLDSTQTTGLSVKDLKYASYIASILHSTSVGVGQSISLAIEEVYDSKIHSSITSDAPFIAKKPKYKLADLILPPEKKETIRYAASLISHIPLVYEKWNFSAIDPYPRAVINFYGKPGTGKTMCAHAIANFLGKDLLALNYAEIESKYIGDAPKKLESAFAYARQHDTVMFFDEADSFLGKRIEDVSHSADQALNSLRSTMLIQLEMFEGVVIFASNLRENYDKAFKSRFLYEIEFNLPDKACRKIMFMNYVRKIEMIEDEEQEIPVIIPMYNANYTNEQIEQLADLSNGLSGREIKSSVLDALNQYAFQVCNNDSSIIINYTIGNVDEKRAHTNNLYYTVSHIDSTQQPLRVFTISFHYCNIVINEHLKATLKNKTTNICQNAFIEKSSDNEIRITFEKQQECGEYELIIPHGAVRRVVDNRCEILPFEILYDCVNNKVANLEQAITVKSDIQKDKELIKEQLSEQYKDQNENQEQYSILISLAYHAAWSDGILDDNELAVIKKAESDLIMCQSLDMTDKSNLQSLDDIVQGILKFNLSSQAVELCCRIVAADGQYVEDELNFIHLLCSMLMIPLKKIEKIDELIVIMAQEGNLLKELNL